MQLKASHYRCILLPRRRENNVRVISFHPVGHANDQKRHLGLLRLRIFKLRWVSVANDNLGPKPLISDSATRKSL